MGRDRQAEYLRQVRGRTSDGQDGAAVLEESAKLRPRLAGCVRAKHRLVFGWNIVDGVAARPSSAGAARDRRCGADCRWKNQHVEPARQVSRIESFRIDDFKRELELLEQEARPTGGHRAAVLI